MSKHVTGILAHKDRSNRVEVPRRQVVARALKRAFDMALAGLALLFASPVLILAAIAIRIEDGSGVLFRQRRIGRGGRGFELLKLRSMRHNDLSVMSVGQVTDSHALVTRTGRILRRLKIDELPQLWNVIRGDMSLVGPRPTVPEQVEKYTAVQWRRLEVSPGMTGWAQVNGNVKVSWDDRIALDIWYVDHWSLWLDFKILLRTVRVIVWGEHPMERELTKARLHAKYSDRRR